MSVNPTSKYGPAVNTQQARDFLLRLFEVPAKDTPPVCLWGRHGIGKTELIKDIAAAQAWPLISISPAQFEEMGDLIGLPFLDQQSETSTTTRFAPPDWVPQDKGPGILLIDDFNRADDRILRGLMALWQERRLSSWSLPDQWYIVLTANPEGDIYSVTPVDEANLTRMLHLELQYDVKSWVAWAQSQNLAEEAITFVQQHPEVIDGQQTTPRTLTFFFRLWRQYGKPAAKEPLLLTLAESAISRQAARQFIQYLQDDTFKLPDILTLLQQSASQTSTLLTQLQNGQAPRNDLISQLCARLLQYVEQRPQLSEEQTQQLLRFLMNEQLPTEQLLLILHSLSAMQHSVLPPLLKEPRLGQLILGD
ncbi:MAG: AAA family ATPase [Bacteroidota bacterium]